MSMHGNPHNKVRYFQPFQSFTTHHIESSPSYRFYLPVHHLCHPCTSKLFLFVSPSPSSPAPGPYMLPMIGKFMCNGRHQINGAVILIDGCYSVPFGVADFVDGNRKLFSGISAFFLSLVPWTQVSKSRSLLLIVEPKVFLIAIGLGAYVQHA
ncbi:putative sodium/metabolite cotransporter BASS4 chloroplastic-like [Trifolium pratense]|uniref:Putative sodium/metabolite cotransporter BASS4 chloroplastic-like n=1 Tax=Trifolium pratense TaxID=57577 RepID=A0A2K3NM91_TRIPR|nr:putative sodium/metabolite cotransporter BASS4 chloroplastic-like [Trifolium pratense]